jgi:hypothetical protein
LRAAGARSSGGSERGDIAIRRPTTEQ